MCAVATALGPRDLSAWVVDGMGRALGLGGTGPTGDWNDEIVVFTEDDETARAYPAGDLLTGIGHSVLPLPEGWIVAGGVGPEGPMHRAVWLDHETARGEQGARPKSTPLVVRGEQAAERFLATTYAAVAPQTSERFVVAGGCAVGIEDVDTFTPDGRCPPRMGRVRAEVLTVEVSNKGLEVREAAPLLRPRYGATLHSFGDDAFVLAGGFDEDGRPVHALEWSSGLGAWEPYGPDPSASLTRNALGELPSVIGSAVFEGGLVALVLSDGRISWSDGETVGVWESSLRVSPASAVLVLPGERLLVDGQLVPIAGLGRAGGDTLDLSTLPAKLGPLPPRVGSKAVLLRDGTALVAGGRDPVDASQETPFLARVRPHLDGPDEGIPRLDPVEAGALLAAPLGAVSQDGGGIVLETHGEVRPWPGVTARVRGFRSQRFWLGARIEAASTAAFHLVMGRRMFEGVAIQVTASRVKVFRRDTRGEVAEIEDCATFVPKGALGERARDFIVEMSPSALVLRERRSGVWVRCGLDLAQPSYVALGASGEGTVRASELLLVRVP